MMAYEQKKIEKATDMIKAVYFNTYNFQSESKAIGFAIDELFNLVEKDALK